MKLYGSIEWRSAVLAPAERKAKKKSKVPRGTPAVFLVTCPPHVMIRLKRLFARLKGQHGTVALTETVETAYELEWFCRRWPMELRGQAAARLQAGADTYRRREALLEEVLADGYAPQSFELAVPPRDYQSLAADLLLRSGALLLGDDVGLGKTASAICALTDPRTRPALVVTLTHLTRQWVRELEKFAPGLRSHVIRTGKVYPLVRRWQPFPDVIVITYSKLAGWAETLAPLIKSVTFDEIQELRTGWGSFKYSAARHVADGAAFKLGLSATPIYNYGGEFLNVVNALQPDVLGSAVEFGLEWCGGAVSNKARVTEPRALGQYIRESGIMLRRTRADVGRELAGLTRIPYEIDADPDVLEAVQTTATELARIILAQSEDSRGAKMRASEELSNVLRRATGVAKAPYVVAFVRMLLEQGERVVLYGWHHAVYDLWREGFARYNPAFYTGRESPAAKDESRRRFVEKETPLIILSLRSGAGLDGLQQVARTVVFGELDWSPGVHEQCEGRVERDGQGDPVMAYYLLAEGGSDPVIADVLALKKAQVEGLRNPDVELLERLEVDPDHIKKLAARYLAEQAAKVGQVTELFPHGVPA